MPLSDKQRISFFKVARVAYEVQQPDMEFNAWRKFQMMEAGLKDSVKKVSKIIGYDTLMLHFAQLAYDMEKVVYFQANEERLLRHIIEGLTKDLDWLFRKISKNTQFFELDQDITEAPVKALRPIMQQMGVIVSTLCIDRDINTGYLPTAAPPYNFRGKRAAAFSEYINLKTGSEKRKQN